jgi:hypothetical protein
LITQVREDVDRKEKIFRYLRYDIELRDSELKFCRMVGESQERAIIQAK